MSWRFVVEMEAGVVGADLHDASIATQPAPWVGLCVEVCINAVAGLQRLTTEAVQEIHQQQLLVLLFVVQPKLHHRFEFRRWLVVEHLHQSGVDRCPPFENVADGWPAQHAPLRTGMALPHSVVIGIELVTPAGITGRMASEMGLKNEGVEKPGGVR